MFTKLKKYFRESFFKTNCISIFTNPHYIIRKELWEEISQIATSIDGRVLDFGCGSKPYRSCFPESCDYIGVDIQSSGHNHKGSNIDFYYNGQDLPFKPNSFDCVISFEVFEHVNNIQEIISEIYRVLKPGGMLIVSTPFLYPEHEMPYDFYRFTTSGIAYQLDRGKFEIIKIRKLNQDLSTPMQILIEDLFSFYKYQHSRKTYIFFLPLIFMANLLVLSCKMLPKRNVRSYSNLIAIAKKNC